jgi:hypothetical protein
MANALLGHAGKILFILFSFVVEEKIFSRTISLARLYVQELDGRDDLSGPAKRAEVAQRIKDDLVRLGDELSPVLINLAIELAVAAMKANMK